jgi:hydantoinase/carbamoylase family amidase
MSQSLRVPIGKDALAAKPRAQGSSLRRARSDLDAESQSHEILARVLEDLEQVAAFSAPGPGVTRLGYTAEDAAARAWFAAECGAAGLEYEADFAGNGFGWAPGARRSKPLLIGSHLDSVLHGGRYDGTLGVCVGLEVARAAVRHGWSYPVGVVAFACEESTRFGFGTIGSRCLMGILSGADLDKVTDREGTTLKDVLLAAGLDPTTGPRIEVDDSFAGAFLEVHIDQGTILAPESGATEYPVGLVTTIVGVSRIRLNWSGQAAHSGARLRSDRHDPLLAAAKFVIEADALWGRHDGGHKDSLAITVGKLDVFPNSPNTVAGQVDLILDVRSTSQKLLDATVASALQLATEIADTGRVRVTSTSLNKGTPVRTDARMIRALAKAATTGSIATKRIPSLSGHDAMVMARRYPAAMIFVGNPSGISHAPTEDLDQDSLRRAIQVILAALPDLSELRDPS